ncbi:MAG: hypothetical protein ACKVQT_20730 [Burkholderiales bacterium]
MEATIEIPDQVFREAKLKAAERGQTLKEFVTDSLREKLGAIASATRADQPAWMSGFGELRRHQKQTRRIQARIDNAFEVVEPENDAWIAARALEHRLPVMSRDASFVGRRSRWPDSPSPQCGRGVGERGASPWLDVLLSRKLHPPPVYTPVEGEGDYRLEDR